MKVPPMKPAFKVKEGCCYEQVIFEGKVDITAKNEHIGDRLNSDDLICDICNPNMKIIPVSVQEYTTIRQNVMYQKMRQAS
jgi:hypothetical protein